MLHISDLHLRPTQQTVLQESASFRLQCAAEVLENIKNDLRECVDLKLRGEKQTLHWDELNAMTISPIDPATSFSKSKILEEKMQREEGEDLTFAHDLPGNEAVKSPHTIRHRPSPAPTRSAVDL
jgi:hypothetical protein